MKAINAVLVLLLSTPAWAAPPAMPPEIGAAYGRLGKAMGARDADGVRQVWAPDVVVNSPSNAVLDREQVIAAMGAELLAYRDFTKHVTRIDVKPEMVVVMGHDTLVPLKGPDAGKRLTRPFTDVWARRDGRWWLVARQATIASVEQGAVE